MQTFPFPVNPPFNYYTKGWCLVSLKDGAFESMWDPSNFEPDPEENEEFFYQFLLRDSLGWVDGVEGEFYIAFADDHVFTQMTLFKRANDPEFLFRLMKMCEAEAYA